MSRPREIGTNLFITHSVRAPNLLPNSLLPRNRKWHSDSVESHPVDKTFPLSPSPPRHCIAESAVIQEETIIRERLHPDRLLNPRKKLRHFNRVVRIPRNCRKTPVVQIAVQSDRDRIAAIPTNHNFVPHRLKLIVLQTVLNDIENKILLIFRNQTLCQRTNGFIVPLRGTRRKKDEKGK